MKKRVSIIFLLIFINISVFAEVGAGYYFRFNNFKLSIDFNEYALDRYLQEDEKYIDALFASGENNHHASIRKHQ